MKAKHKKALRGLWLRQMLKWRPVFLPKVRRWLKRREGMAHVDMLVGAAVVVLAVLLIYEFLTATGVL